MCSLQKNILSVWKNCDYFKTVRETLYQKWCYTQSGIVFTSTVHPGNSFVKKNKKGLVRETETLLSLLQHS